MIKKILLISLIFGTSLVYSQFQRPVSEILKKDGYYYLLEDYLLYGDKSTKFNGRVYELTPNDLPIDGKPPFLDDDDLKIYLKNKSHDIHVLREFNVLNGLLHGSYKLYDWGTIHQEFTYEFGILEGPFKEYCRTGKVKVSVDYKNGKRNGDYRSIHCLESDKDGGVLIQETGTYLNGRKDGEWISKYSDGRIRYHFLIKDGVRRNLKK
tara:strand:+ start:47 stop:673 length:627 start_codon:yes stop_codon:yes gene_type:complete